MPVDDVPREIVTLAKHSEDVAHLAQEQDGYVPDDDDDMFCVYFVVFSYTLSLTFSNRR